MIGEEEYEKNLKILKTVEAKEQDSGLFKADLDIIDRRTEEEKGDAMLHPGYNITCGNRGGKLSGG